MSGLSRGRRTWTKRVAKVAACGLLAASASMAVAGVAVAGGGNNGTVFINSVSFDANGNDPHIGCPIVLEWDGFDSNGADFTVNFAPHAPTGGTVASSGNLTGHFATVGGKHKETYYLSFTDGPQNSGEWHLDVQVDTSNSNGSSISKSKTVWVKDCGVAMDVDKDGTASGHPGDPVSYTLTVDNNNGPSLGTTTVTDSLPAGLDPGTMVYTSGAGSWNCANTTNATKSQTPSCTSTSTLPHNSVTVFTVTSAIGQNTAAGTLVNTGTVAWPGDHDSDTFNTSVLAVNANAPDVGVSKSGTSTAFAGDPVSYSVVATVSNGAGDGPTTGTVTVSDTLPVGFTGGSMAYTSGTGSAGATTAANWTCAGLSCHTNAGIILQKGDTVTFTVSATAAGTGTKTDTANVSTTGDSNAANNQDTFDTVMSQPANLTLTAICSQTAGQADWTVTNPAGNPTVNTLAVVPSGQVQTGPSPASIAGGATSTFTTTVPLSPANSTVHVTGVTTPGGQNVTSNSVGFTSPCTTPPQPGQTAGTVAFSSTCDGIHVVFTSGTPANTSFDVTKPDGTLETVTGSDMRDYAADATNSHMSVSHDGATETFDWTEPAGCQQPPGGTADPEVTGANHCKTGINLVLSNMNGTAGTVFTVTDPDGATQKLPVRAGQMKKVNFEVTEDTTATATVSAPGLAKKTFTYKKDCADVLGVKHVRPPKKPVVEGEKETLPFTGFDTQRAMLDGAALLFLGAVICGLAARRRPLTTD